MALSGLHKEELFLGRDPCDLTYKWKEWHLQAYIVMMARRSNLIVHGDQNGAHKSRTSASLAKATGMLAGWPDLCFILHRGPVWVELKKGKEKRSKEQIALHGIMELSNCEVHTVNADCPAECWNKVEYILGL